MVASIQISIEPLPSNHSDVYDCCKSQCMEKPEFSHHAVAPSGVSESYQMDRRQPTNQQHVVLRQALSKRLRARLRRAWNRMCKLSHKVSSPCIVRFEVLTAHTTRTLEPHRYPQVQVLAMLTESEDTEQRIPHVVQHLSITMQRKAQITLHMKLTGTVVGRESWTL